MECANVYNTAKKLIRRALRRGGWDLHRLSPASNSHYQLLKAFEYFKVDFVFDIGANIGQFAQNLRSVGYNGNIVSFEPLSVAHSALVTAAKGDRQWYIHPRTAIGDYDGEIEINISGNSVSSSVLPMLEAHAAAASDSTYVATEHSPIARLDTVSHPYLRDESRYFVKIDVQGFEWQVLDGATETLERAQGVLCELSLVPLYAGQHLWREVIERLEAQGFALWAIQSVFTDPRDGRSLQVDGIFFRI
jgi:FkbM family methyltransferase